MKSNRAPFKPTPFQLKNACALITGASSGLGSEFARQLAPDVNALILVARRGERLQRLAEELKNLYPKLSIYQKIIDLSHPEEREKLATWIYEQKLPLNLLINNAGLGDLGEFSTASWSRLNEILTLNITALTHLTHLLLPSLRNHAPSALLHVGSVAGFFPTPGTTVYGASKAYVRNFSEGLRIEEKKHGVIVSLLCPGPSPTEFFDVASRSPEERIPATSRAPALFITSPKTVVKTALQGILLHQASIIPNRLLNGIMIFLDLLPFFLLRKILSKKA
ncbi:MAG: hypothetical protein A3F67_00145 [Verrucomicrobia bacterium RIFCSPHIGHO2_12_FULL_41_10]|nr:MAG: hypothetical protein A3F67_00145 [Verrucomicrobia bacterium RIFCSPHIGHO2_12_FULL_41_10]